MSNGRTRVAVNGYGVIGKRVAEAVVLQDDMELAGVADVTSDWRMQVADRKGMRIHAAVPKASAAMTANGIEVAGNLDELLAAADVVVDCTPKKVAAANVETYRRMGKKFILQGGEKHDVTGHSFVAECSYGSALGREATRVVSCNTSTTSRSTASFPRKRMPNCILLSSRCSRVSMR